MDTNGFNSKILKELIDENLVDYVAMDIKNEMCKYSVTCGLNQMKIDNIKESIQLLENSSIDYEFRTTIMKEYHTKYKDLIKTYVDEHKDSPFSFFTCTCFPFSGS